jgi:hypothetical protein
MFHSSTFAFAGLSELRAQAARPSRAIAGRSLRRAQPHHPPRDQGAALLIRPASAADEPAIARLSALDEHVLPHGERLVGELGGRVVAALDVRSGDAVADPFVPTTGLVELLGLRAAQVRR